MSLIHHWGRYTRRMIEVSIDPLCSAILEFTGDYTAWRKTRTREVNKSSAQHITNTWEKG